jgi:hypothetical protein
VLIPKGVKVLCFDTLLQVLILKGLALHQNCARWEERGLHQEQKPVTNEKGGKQAAAMINFRTIT